VEPELAYGPHASFLVNWMLPSLRPGVARGAWPDAAGRAASGSSTRTMRSGALLTALHRRQGVGGAAAPGPPLPPGTRWRHQRGSSASSWAGIARPDGTLPGSIEAAAAGSWDELVAVGAELPRQATAAHPLATRARGYSAGLGRLPAAALRMRHGRGFSVALLGPDGAGKSTLSSGIVANFGLPGQPRLHEGLWAGRGGPATIHPPGRACRRHRPLKVCAAT